MGRSVSTHTYASTVAYQTFGPDEATYREMFDEDIEAGFIEEDEDFDDWMYSRWNDVAGGEFTDLIDWVRERVAELFPSMSSVDRWQGRENHVILANAHSEVSISEYCGVVAICLAENFDYEQYWRNDGELANLGAHWRKTVADTFNKNFSEMQAIGRFSDGTQVYSKEA